MNEVVKPCFWMRVALNRMAEGRKSLLWDWYAKKHLERCPQCTKTYRMLLAMRDALRSTGQTGAASWLISDEKWREIESACEEPDQAPHNT
jgi:hypothetical protein